MGGKSKSRSSSSNQVNTGALTQQGANQQARQMNSAVGHQQGLQNSQMSQVMPAFGQMIGGAMESFGSNPMMNMIGAAFGMPVQMQTPDFIQDFIDKYSPQEPATPVEQAPHPYNINDDMRMRMGMGGPYQPYANLVRNESLYHRRR